MGAVPSARDRPTNHPPRPLPEKNGLRLSIESISKRYRGGVQALADFSLEVGPGVLGLLGPNGAGKSTLMRIVATVTRPSGGRVVWNGADVAREPDAIRRVLGYLPQEFGVYPNLTAPEFLAYLAAVKGLPAGAARRRIDELLQLVNLTESRTRRLGSYSGGMRQRIGIAQALLNDPRLLIVDEPTGGLDPEERVRFRALLAELSGERVVILSTHIVSDVEAVATRIALIASGRLLEHATPEALVSSAEGKCWEWTVSSDEFPRVKREHQVSATARREGGVRVRVVAQTRPVEEATAVPPTLEDAYLLRLVAHRAAVVA